MKRTAPYLLLAAAMLVASCQSEEPRPEASHPEASHHEEPGHEEPGHEEPGHEEPGHEDAHAHHGEGASGEALPLRPIMQQLGSNMAGFMHALWLEEYAHMEEFAEAIAAHPHISEEELERIRTTLGEETAAFDAADVAVHEAAVRLHTAAEARDLDRILQELHEVQVGCMACHTQFRERLRTDQVAP